MVDIKTDEIDQINMLYDGKRRYNMLWITIRQRAVLRIVDNWLKK